MSKFTSFSVLRYFKTLGLNEHVNHAPSSSLRSQNHKIHSASSLFFLSPSFKCEKSWNVRLKEDTTLTRIQDLEQLFFDIERKLESRNRGSPVDIDIFANLVTTSPQLLHLEELLYKFRLTPQTYLMMPSTTFATCRAFLEYGTDKDKAAFVRMLDDPFNYGLFPDNSSLVSILDHFLVEKEWKHAAKVAVYMMLQEDVKVPIAHQMGLYSLFKYYVINVSSSIQTTVSAQHVDDGGKAVSEEANATDKSFWDESDWLSSPIEKVEEPEDDVKIRVEYLDSGYFDDHFDLTRKRHQIGKALVMFVEALLSVSETTSQTSFDSTPDESVNNSLLLLGWTLYEKYDKVAEMLRDNTKSSAKHSPTNSDSSLSRTIVIDHVANLIPGPNHSVVVNQIHQLIPQQNFATVNTVGDGNDTMEHIERGLREAVERAVTKYEKDYIFEQEFNFSHWMVERRTAVEKELKAYDVKVRSRRLAESRVKMEKEEEELFFFERQNEYDVRKQEKLLAYQKTFPARKWQQGRRITINRNK